MFEFHGWATIRCTTENPDVEGEVALQDAAVEAVRESIRTSQLDQWGNVLFDLSVRNGGAQLTVAGLKNHGAIRDDVLGLYRYIAQVAPGSYGIVYIYDDEDAANSNAFRVHVLARGTVTEHSDPFLSPFVPVVEDRYPFE